MCPASVPDATATNRAAILQGGDARGGSGARSRSKTPGELDIGDRGKHDFGTDVEGPAMVLEGAHRAANARRVAGTLPEVAEVKQLALYVSGDDGRRAGDNFGDLITEADTANFLYSAVAATRGEVREDADLVEKGISAESRGKNSDLLGDDRAGVGGSTEAVQGGTPLNSTRGVMVGVSHSGLLIPSRGYSTGI